MPVYVCSFCSEAQSRANRSSPKINPNRPAATGCAGSFPTRKDIIYIYIYIYTPPSLSLYLSIYLSLSLYIYIYICICMYVFM